MSALPTAPRVDHADPPAPPVAWFSVAALVSVIIGGILMASYAPRPAPLGAPTVLLGVAILSLATSVTLLVRFAGFMWATFWRVFKWAQLAYVIMAAMIEFAFVHDHTVGSSLVLVTLMLMIFALSVPITIAFTTARYADPE